MKLNLEAVKKLAQEEIEAELLLAAIEKEKIKIRAGLNKPFWHKVFPFKITITRR